MKVPTFIRHDLVKKSSHKSLANLILSEQQMHNPYFLKILSEKENRSENIKGKSRDSDERNVHLIKLWELEKILMKNKGN